MLREKSFRVYLCCWSTLVFLMFSVVFLRNTIYGGFRSPGSPEKSFSDGWRANVVYVTLLPPSGYPSILNTCSTRNVILSKFSTPTTLSLSYKTFHLSFVLLYKRQNYGIFLFFHVVGSENPRSSPHLTRHRLRFRKISDG